jgi:hypothetical protein
VDALSSSATPAELHAANVQLLGDRKRPRTALWTPEALTTLLTALAFRVTRVDVQAGGALRVVAQPDGPAPSAQSVAEIGAALDG